MISRPATGKWLTFFTVLVLSFCEGRIKSYYLMMDCAEVLHTVAGGKIQLELGLSYAFAGPLVYNEDDLGQVSSKW